MKAEIWKDIEGYEGLYQVSNSGKVKSLQRILYKPTAKYKTTVNGRILRHGYNRKGYPVVGLSKNNKLKTFPIHRLVAKSFLGMTTENVNHLDFDKTNNNISNLELVNSRENSSHRSLNKVTSSEYVGVSKHRASGKWRTTIIVNGKQKSLGYHESQEAARQAYIQYINKNNIKNKYAA